MRVSLAGPIAELGGLFFERFLLRCGLWPLIFLQLFSQTANVEETVPHHLEERVQLEEYEKCRKT